MKKVPLTRGYTAIVDDSDYPLVSGRRWYAAVTRTGLVYALHDCERGGIRHRTYMHRLITGAQKGREEDHKNHDGLDNRRENLRLCSHAQNMANRRSLATRKRPFRGVAADGKKFNAFIAVNGKPKYLGRFDSAEDAARRYDAAAREIHGEFAVMNFGT